VQTFILESESGDDYYYLTVGIKNLPPNIAASSLKPNGIWDISKLEQLWSAVARNVSAVRTREESISGGNIPIVKFSTSEIVDDVTFISAILFALHGDKLLKLECGFNSFGSDIEFAQIDLTKDETCQTYFNSLNFTDNP
jgi:hypothetical protein